jgi:5-methyltetrahydropteroyltriglutamate--homocysteine methyltransferase
LREEVAALSCLGATYIQLDAPHYTSLLHATNREFYERQGWTIEGWLDRGIELENAVMEGHPELTFGFHL